MYSLSEFHYILKLQTCDSGLTRLVCCRRSAVDEEQGTTSLLRHNAHVPLTNDLFILKGCFILELWWNGSKYSNSDFLSKKLDNLAIDWQYISF